MDSDEANVTNLPGWWGKIPSTGDFVGRRLPQSFIDPWDRWLSHELQSLKSSDSNWQDRYLNGPVWWFCLGPGMLIQRAWVGILSPSVDRAGRFFPLTFAVPLNSAGDEEESNPLEQSSIRTLMLKLEEIALFTLENEISPQQVDQQLSEKVCLDDLKTMARINEPRGYWVRRLTAHLNSSELPNALTLWPKT